MCDIKVIQSKIIVLRGRKVIFDRDLAEMYGVETKVLKQAVRRNIERFPDDFMFELTNQEFANWRSQFVTSKSDKMGLRYKPYAFTEEGVGMLSGILKSPVAVQVNIAIMRAFVAMRQLITETINPVSHLEKEMANLKKYIEEVFADYNDINEDTRMQIELINETIAELQVQGRKREHKRIGFSTVQE